MAVISAAFMSVDLGAGTGRGCRVSVATVLTPAAFVSTDSVTTDASGKDQHL